MRALVNSARTVGRLRTLGAARATTSAVFKLPPIEAARAVGRLRALGAMRATTSAVFKLPPIEAARAGDLRARCWEAARAVGRPRPLLEGRAHCWKAAHAWSNARDYLRRIQVVALRGRAPCCRVENECDRAWVPFRLLRWPRRSETSHSWSSPFARIDLTPKFRDVLIPRFDDSNAEW